MFPEAKPRQSYRSTFAGNSALLPSDVNVARLEILAGNNFIVICHVTSKKPMRARAVGKHFQLYNNWALAFT